MEDHREVKLVISPEVREVLEARAIRDEDLQKTIFQAEQNAEKFVHPETGRFLAGVRPYFVTFWVEYDITPEGYLVHSAYKHRVKITGEGQS